jgi:ubiquinone/menaquinone biosynthesis C-methylase UbiE
MKKGKNRWYLAQQHEQKWWERVLPKGDLTYFAKYAEEFLSSVHDITAITEKTRILEIGSGPAGILTHLPVEFRCGIDPLEYFYGLAEKSRQIRDTAVHYFAAQGEYLPFCDNSFDVILIDNVLDHCENVGAVFKEMKRVLAAGGIVYLKNGTFTWWGMILSGILEFFQIDRGHPYHFSEKDLCVLFSTHRLDPLSVSRRGFLRHYRNLFTSGKVSSILRALSFSQADKVTFILRNGK